MPTGFEGIPTGCSVAPPDRSLLIDLRLRDSGDELVVVRSDGVFTVRSSGVTRVFPLEAELEALFDDGDLPAALEFPMIHAAPAPSESLVAVGDQSSQHDLVTFDGKLVSRFGPVRSSYPHHAAFDACGEVAIFNSCHFYDGVTVGGRVAELKGLETAEYGGGDRLRVVDDRCRVYASAYHDGIFVLGDAAGYLRGRSPDGRAAWEHHTGSTVNSIDLDPDGRRVAVGNAAGFLHLIDLHTGDSDPFQIGNATHRERLRFIVWKGEAIWRW